MQQEQLGYARTPARQTPPLAWGVLAAIGVVAPFVTVPVFVFGAAFLQDYLINGDGRSWHRAYLRMAIPTGLVTAVGLVGSVRVCIHPAWRQPAAIVGVVVSSLALLLIGYSTFGP